MMIDFVHASSSIRFASLGDDKLNRCGHAFGSDQSSHPNSSRRTIQHHKIPSVRSFSSTHRRRTIVARAPNTTATRRAPRPRANARRALRPPIERTKRRRRRQRCARRSRGSNWNWSRRIRRYACIQRVERRSVSLCRQKRAHAESSSPARS